MIEAIVSEISTGSRVFRLISGDIHLQVDLSQPKIAFFTLAIASEDGSPEFTNFARNLKGGLPLELCDLLHHAGTELDLVLEHDPESVDLFLKTRLTLKLPEGDLVVLAGSSLDEALSLGTAMAAFAHDDLGETGELIRLASGRSWRRMGGWPDHATEITRRYGQLLDLEAMAEEGEIVRGPELFSLRDTDGALMGILVSWEGEPASPSLVGEALDHCDAAGLDLVMNGEMASYFPLWADIVPASEEIAPVLAHYGVRVHDMILRGRLLQEVGLDLVPVSVPAAMLS
ncbi:hypothetical protein [Defluviimonas salinarum]|uniref:Uncharacterized protein n=1 Tax=Defluviimonas salinarum TaxID=2992147 RepID=A0ABT3J479_9RHOB|nr:hypothetical protein [Defluviimonas salinarum]MCW3782478.1 hypothetical protein [Defluviimonas salinarum]